MDVLENGPETTPRRRGGLSTLVGALALVAVAAVVVVQRRDPAPPPTPAPSPSETIGVRADLVAITGAEGESSSFDSETREFVIQLSLRNFNSVPVRVRAVPPADRPAVTGLTMAVMPAGNATELPDRRAVRAAASPAIALNGLQTGWLVIAGKLSCDANPVDLAAVSIEVDGTPVEVPVPAGTMIESDMISGC